MLLFLKLIYTVHQVLDTGGQRNIEIHQVLDTGGQRNIEIHQVLDTGGQRNIEIHQVLDTGGQRNIEIYQTFRLADRETLRFTKHLDCLTCACVVVDSCQNFPGEKKNCFFLKNIGDIERKRNREHRQVFPEPIPT